MSFRKIQIIEPESIGNPEIGHIYLGQSVLGLWEKFSDGHIAWITTGSTYSGSSGVSGASGSSGVDGTFYGTNGTSGLSGTSGTSGLSGTSGSSGTSGRTGSSGLTGTSGSSGKGSSGISGTSGTSGTSGKTGTSGSSGVDGTFYGTSGISGGYGGSSRKWVAIDSFPTTGQFYSYYSLNGSTNFTLIDTLKIYRYDADGQDLRYWLNSWNLGGILKIENRLDFTNFGIYNVSALTLTSYGNIYELQLNNIIAIAGNGSLIPGDEYLISFISIGSGSSGTSGLGSPGSSGTSGTGSSGTSGISGINGTSGTSGFGSSGTSGVTGTSGTSGITGTSGTAGGSVFGIDFFPYDVLDPDLSGLTYYQLIRWSPSEIEQDDYATITGSTSDEYLIEVYITPLDDPKIDHIPPGIWKLHSYCYIDSGGTTSINNIISKIYSRTTGGTETLIASINSINIQSTDILNPDESDTEYYTTTGITMDTTDRIVVKYYAKSSLLGRTVHFLHSGFLHATHITTPITSGQKGNDGTSGTSGTSGTGSSGTSGISEGLIDVIGFEIRNVATGQTYTLDLFAPYTYNISGISYKSDVGTIVFDIQYNLTGVTGLINLSGTTSTTSNWITSNNTVSGGNMVTLYTKTISGGATILDGNLKNIRT